MADVGEDVQEKREAVILLFCLGGGEKSLQEEDVIHQDTLLHHNTYGAHLVNIESCLRCVADNKDDHYRSEYSGHC